MVPVNDPVEEMLREVRDQIGCKGVAILVEHDWPALRSRQHAVANAVGRECVFTLALTSGGAVLLHAKPKDSLGETQQ